MNGGQEEEAITFPKKKRGDNTDRRIWSEKYPIPVVGPSLDSSTQQKFCWLTSTDEPKE